MDKCRLCYTDADPDMCQHIFNSKFKPPIWKIIEHLSNLKITNNDPYTKNICGPCFLDLVNYSAFRKKILDTDYRIHYAEQRRHDDHDYFLVHCTPTSSDSEDSIVKEEQIEIEEHLLKIEEESDEEFNNSSVTVTDNQDIKELIVSVDRINNNENITTCYTSPNDNSLKVQNTEKQSTLQNRARTQTDETPIKCNICDKQSSNKTNLCSHKQVHTNEKPYCNICGKAFLCNFALLRHSRVHTGEKPFKCTICNKRFSQKAHLWSHKRIHTGEKPFKCKICNRRFSDKTNLLTHERIHTGEKPFKCNICNKQFVHKGNLDCHKRIHTGEKPFKCNICKKQFSQKMSLCRHERVHTGEKPFKCNVCNKQFSYESSMLNHERIHTGEKPFKCSICNKQFSQKVHLWIHQRVHTDEKTD